MLTFDARTMPECFSAIPNPASILYVEGGDLDQILSKPRVAIVGSRKVDSYGIYVTKMLASGLAERGVVVVSGLALGVDSIAHSACLDAGGQTVAILPSGIENVYPRSHTTLAKRIISNNGRLVSEHSGRYSPQRHDFLIRNRLVSALADIVIITEAASRSGTLNTAGHALEQGKTVMAVPGPITNPLCEGTNRLIKNGAIPITNLDDVLEELGLPVEKQIRDYDLLASSAEESAIITLMLAGIQDGEALLAGCGLDESEFNATMTLMEISGIIRPLGSNQWALS